MGTAIGTALVLVTLAVLIYPFLRRGYKTPADATQERLRAEKLRVYRTISDLEADRASGTVSEEDFQAQLLELKLAAARVLREQAGATTAGGGEAALERAVEAARRARRGLPGGPESP